MNNHRDNGLIEQVARAICKIYEETTDGHVDCIFGREDRELADDCREMARAAIAAHDTALTAKIAGLEGAVTDAMIEAGGQAVWQCSDYSEGIPWDLLYGVEKESCYDNARAIFIAMRSAALSPKDGPS